MNIPIKAGKWGDVITILVLTYAIRRVKLSRISSCVWHPKTKIVFWDFIFCTARVKSWIIWCLIRVNPFVRIILHGVCTTRDTVMLNSLKTVAALKKLKLHTGGALLNMYMHGQTVILAGGDFNSSINATNVIFQSNHVVWRGVSPWYFQHEISSLWTRSDRSMSSSSGKSVLPLAYWLVDTRWRRQGIRTNKHSLTACKTSRQ